MDFPRQETPLYRRHHQRGRWGFRAPTKLRVAIGTDSKAWHGWAEEPEEARLKSRGQGELSRLGDASPPRGGNPEIKSGPQGLALGTSLPT